MAAEELSGLGNHETFLTSILENIPHMIFVKDAKELRFVRFNKAGEDLLGIDRANLIGKNDFDLFTKEQAEFFTEKDRQVLNGKKVFDIPEEPIDTPRGTRILHTKKIPLLDESGKPVYLLGISEDITESKQLQDKLINAKKMEAVGTLAGGVAHEFNNILTSIMFSAGFIKNALPLKDPKVNFVEEIFVACRRAGLLTRQLLSFSLQDITKPKTIDCNAAIVQTKRLISTLLGQKIKLSLELAADLPQIRIDPSAFEQMVINFSDNAAEAMRDGGEFTIETCAVSLPDANPSECHRGKTGNFVCVQFRDTGVGMNEETKKHLFEPFFTTKGRSQGTGLGLAATFGSVNAAGGFICVASAPGIGTTFKVYLPQSTISGENNVEKTSGEGTAWTKVPRILLVEDENGLRKAAQRILKSDGYDVVSAANGEEAMSIVQNEKEFDLLLTDVVMPGMGGAILADKIQTLQPGIKIIFMSGYATAELTDKNFIKEKEPLLMKPITPDELSQKVRETLTPPAKERNGASF